MPDVRRMHAFHRGQLMEHTFEELRHVQNGTPLAAGHLKDQSRLWSVFGRKFLHLLIVSRILQLASAFTLKLAVR